MKTVKIYGVTYTGKEVAPGMYEFIRISKNSIVTRISDNPFAFEMMSHPEFKTAHSAAKRAIRFMFI